MKVYEAYRHFDYALCLNPFSGIGNPEPLKHNWTGYGSRRIDREHRIVYKVTDNALSIAQCRYHY